MMSGPFLELYVRACEQDRLVHGVQYAAPQRQPSLLAQWLARALVCLAALLSEEQVRIASQRTLVPGRSQRGAT